MKKTILFYFLLVSCAIAQNGDGNSIPQLMLKSKYSQVVKIFEEKESNGDKLTYDEQFNLALAYQRLLNNHKAVRILVSLSIKKSKDAAVLLALAQSFRALGNNRAAAGVYNEVTEKDSSNIVARIELGKLEIEMKNFKAAKSGYEQLLIIDSTSVYYHRQYGYVLYKLGKNEEAQKELRKALEINKLDAKAALWLAKIFYDKHEYDEAFKTIKKSMTYNPLDLQLNKLGAEVLFKMKKYNSASVQYQNLIMLGDTNAVIYQKLGLSLYSSISAMESIEKMKKEEKLNEAIEAFEKSIKNEDTENPLTLTYLGFCFEALKQYNQAIVYLEKALHAMTPEYIDKVYSNLGASYDLTNNYPEAIKAYMKSLKYSNKNPNTVFRLATLFDRYYADKTVALANYNKYLKLAGKTKDASTEYAEERIEKLKKEIFFHESR